MCSFFMTGGSPLFLGGLKVFLCEHLEILHVCSPVKKKKAGKPSQHLWPWTSFGGREWEKRRSNSQFCLWILPTLAGLFLHTCVCSAHSWSPWNISWACWEERRTELTLYLAHYQPWERIVRKPTGIPWVNGQKWDWVRRDAASGCMT